MNLYQIRLAQMVIDIGLCYQNVLVHAKTPQSAGRIVKREYPGWEKLSMNKLSDRPGIVMTREWK